MKGVNNVYYYFCLKNVENCKIFRKSFLIFSIRHVLRLFIFILGCFFDIPLISFRQVLRFSKLFKPSHIPHLWRRKRKRRPDEPAGDGRKGDGDDVKKEDADDEIPRPEPRAGSSESSSEGEEVFELNWGREPRAEEIASDDEVSEKDTVRRDSFIYVLISVFRQISFLIYKCLSICRPVCLSICQSICRPVCLSICQSICPSACLSL